jgi:hypothetical protein
MNVVTFSGKPPTSQQVLEVVYRFSSQRPAWQLELLHGDDGQPFVEAVHSLGGTVLGFHWKPGGWAVVDANARLLEERESLDQLMAVHLS